MCRPLYRKIVTESLLEESRTANASGRPPCLPRARTLWRDLPVPLGSALVVVLLFLSGSVPLAAKSVPLPLAAVSDCDGPTPVVTVFGTDFDDGTAPPSVFLAQPPAAGVSLDLIGWDQHSIEAVLPFCDPGTYLLIVSNRGGEGQLSLALGEVGPVGPKGRPGRRGSLARRVPRDRSARRVPRVPRGRRAPESQSEP